MCYDTIQTLFSVRYDAVQEATVRNCGKVSNLLRLSPRNLHRFKFPGVDEVGTARFPTAPDFLRSALQSP
jgi:hypothetical protein